jgi:hypothetical protein
MRVAPFIILAFMGSACGVRTDVVVLNPAAPAGAAQRTVWPHDHPAAWVPSLGSRRTIGVRPPPRRSSIAM